MSVKITYEYTCDICKVNIDTEVFTVVENPYPTPDYFRGRVVILGKVRFHCCPICMEPMQKALRGRIDELDKK